MHTSLGMTRQAGTVKMLAVGFVTAMTDYRGNTIMAVTDDYPCLATNPAVIHTPVPTDIDRELEDVTDLTASTLIPPNPSMFLKSN